MDKSIEAGSVFERYEKLKKLRIGINTQFLLMGQELIYFHEKDKFKFIEGSGTTWTEFVSKLALGRQHSYDLMKLYSEFIEKWKIPETLLAQTDRRNLISTLPLVSKATKRDYVLEKVYQAKELSRTDLSITLKQEKYPDHEHIWERITYRICKICGIKDYAPENTEENQEEETKTENNK